MGFWPFGGGKKERATNADAHEKHTRLGPSAPRAAPAEGEDEKMAHTPTTTPRPSGRPGDTGRSRRLSRNQGQSIKSPASSSKRNLTRTSGDTNTQAMYRQTPFSQTSIGPEGPLSVHSPPTLHPRRGDREGSLSRQKSAKRKAEDYAREREIRAMASAPGPIAKRPSFHNGPLQRDRRQVPGGLNARLERPMSEVSLPIPEFLDELPDMPNASSYKVSTLAALGPRPTVRHEHNPRAGKAVPRENEAVQRAIAANDVSDAKRIDELANDLNAKGLRELLDRDRRRRERKREQDKHRLHRKLQQREENQRAEEKARQLRTEAYVRNSPAVPSSDTDHDARPSARPPPTTSGAVEDPAVPEDDPFAGEPGPAFPSRATPIRNPFEDEQDLDDLHDQSMEHERGGSRSPVAAPVAAARPPSTVPAVPHTLSPPVSPVYRTHDQASFSQGSASVLGREPASDVPPAASPERRTSGQPERRLSTWTTFFKRGTRRKLVIPSNDRPAAQSEFSNTSRESFQRRQISPPVAAPRTFRRSNSGTPQRTLSRFREDLPELPISPPDSRIASPEAELPGPASTARAHGPNGHDAPSIPAAGGSAHAAGLSTAREGQGARPSPPSGGGGLSAVAPLSNAMASVDSEASWLSGRAERRSGAGEALAARAHSASSHRPARGAVSSGHGPGQAGRPPSVEQSLTSIPGLLAAPSDDEDELLGPGQHVARDVSTDTTAPRGTPLSEVEARVGDDLESPGFDLQDAPLLRARSVDYSVHARHISAGSAKLLDIKRSSTHSDLHRDLSRAGSPVQERKSGLRLHDEASDQP